MKKIISLSALTILGIITIVSSASSQGIALNQKKAETIFSAPETNEQPVDINRINDVNGKVLRSFYRSFGEKPDAKWAKTDNGFVVHFKDSNISTNVYFRNNGAIEYRVNYYSEDQLPASVRHTVRSNFYDYSIRQVSEVHKDGDVSYFVKVEDKLSVKTIRVVEQEWQVVEEITKQVSPISKGKGF